MSHWARRWARAMRASRAFGGSRSGATAVEFALVAAPFFFLMFSVLEVALVFFASTNLESATWDAARDIRTGEFQSTAGANADLFRQAVCANASNLLDCSRVSVDVRTFASFDSVNASNPLDADRNLNEAGFGFTPGTADQIVLVRVFYRWQVLTPSLGTGFVNMAGNQRLLTATAAFRNEPFS